MQKGSKTMSLGMSWFSIAVLLIGNTAAELYILDLLVFIVALIYSN